MEPAEYQAWLSGGAHEGSLASSRREAVRRPRLQHLSSSRRAGPRAGARGPVRQDGRRCRSARRVIVDEAYIRESILNPSAKIAAGFQPIMPTFQGLVSEEQLLAADRVREVARTDRRRSHVAAVDAARSMPSSLRRITT